METNQRLNGKINLSYDAYKKLFKESVKIALKYIGRNIGYIMVISFFEVL